MTMKEQVLGAIETTRISWEAACQWDNVDPAEKFVVFGKDNPFLDEYSRAVEFLQSLTRSVQL